MKQQTDTVPVVIRPRWRGSDEQEAALADLAREFEKSRRHEEAGWSIAEKARKLGIPDTVICQRGDISRTTLQRKLGYRPGGEAAENE